MISMTVTMMICLAIDPLNLALTATMLPMVMTVSLGNPTWTSQDVTMLVCQANFLKYCHILTALIILPGTLIQMTTLTILFILTVMEIVKTQLSLIIHQLIWNMNPTNNLHWQKNPADLPPSYVVCNYTNPETKEYIY